MKVIIAGGRDYREQPSDFGVLDDLAKMLALTEVVSGGARGADALGERWAYERGHKVTRFEANWQKEGRKAGPLRNQRMADYADALVVFPGGSGTADMMRRARAKGMRVLEVMG